VARPRRGLATSAEGAEAVRQQAAVEVAAEAARRPAAAEAVELPRAAAAR